MSRFWPPSLRDAHFLCNCRFESPNVVCLENIGDVVLTVQVDRGSLGVATIVTVDFRTIADSAVEHEDYHPASGTLRFEPHESTKQIKIGIVDNDGETSRACPPTDRRALQFMRRTSSFSSSLATSPRSTPKTRHSDGRRL